MGWQDAPIVGEKPASSAERAMRQAVKLSPEEQVKSDAFERSPGNLKELQSEIAKTNDPEKLALLLGAHEQLTNAPKASPRWANAPVADSGATQVPERTGAAAIPVGGTQEAPQYADQLPPTPSAGAPAKPEGGALRTGLGALETLASVGTGATTGMASGIGSLVNNAVKRAGYALTGIDTAQLPSTEQSFTQGVQAGTYAPRSAKGREQSEAVGTHVLEPLANLGNALGPLGAEVGMGLRGLSSAVKGTRGLGVGGTLKTVPGVETVSNAAGKVAEAVVPTISKRRAEIAQAGAEQGLTYAPHQLADNKFVKMAGETAESVPGAFGKMRKTERQEAFHKALIKQINPETDAKLLTPEVFGEAMDRSGSKIGEIAQKTEVPLPEVKGGFDAYRRRMARATESDRSLAEGYIAEFERVAEENGGVIPGENFKALNSELGQQIRSNAGNSTGNLLSGLQDVVMDAFRKRLSEADRTVYDISRREYAKAKTILPLVAKSVEGEISPAALMQAINATKAGKNSMAQGYAGELGELARAGKYLVDAKSSGTAERSLVHQLILDPVKSAVKVATVYPAATAYNVAGPAITRAMIRKGLKKGSVEPPEVGGVPPETAPPSAGAVAPEPTAPVAPTDPRLAEVAKLRESAKSDAVKAALDEHEKTVQKVIKTEETAKKRAQDVTDLEAAAKATLDKDLRATLQAKADKLRAEKVPVGEVKELETVPTPKVVEPKSIPTGKVVEGQPEIPPAKSEKIPTAEATEIPLETIAPEESIPVGEAAPLPSNRPAGEVRSNVPSPFAISNKPSGVAEPVSSIPSVEPQASAQRALLDEAATAGIKFPVGPYKTEMAWAKEHGLSGPEIARAKNVAKALELDERAVEKAAMQFEKSPVAFDREITRILEKGSENAPEGKQATQSSKGPAPSDSLPGATEAPSKQPGANSAPTPGAASEGGSPTGQAKGGIEIRETPEGFEAYRDGKKVGSLKSNLTPKQSKELKENASVDMVKVEKAEQGKREIGPALYDAWTKAHEGRTEISGKTEANALKLWKRKYPEKVEAFVKQEAERIKSGSDPQLVVGNIKDPEIAQRVLAAAKAPKGFEKGAKKKGS